jgi:hypothetical protein
MSAHSGEVSRNHAADSPEETHFRLKYTTKPRSFERTHADAPQLGSNDTVSQLTAYAVTKDK